MSDGLAIVGQRAVKLDAAAKATGRARYVSDLLLPRLLHARLLRSPHPHARVLRVDASAALALPGVRAVLSTDNLAERFPDLPSFDPACHEFEREPEGAALAGDQRLFDATVRYAGEPVAAVVAESDAQARAALDHIAVEYATLPAVLDAEQAEAEGAPRLHDGALNNLAGRLSRQVGDVDAALADAALVLERRFVTSKQKQAQLEPPCCVAEVAADGKLTVWSPTQAPHRVRLTLARLFGLPLHRVRVVVPPTGGAFGKNDGVIGEPYAVALALLLGRPVKLTFSRREDFVGTESRHPTTTRLTAGFRADGTIVALRARAGGRRRLPEPQPGGDRGPAPPASGPLPHPAC